MEIVRKNLAIIFFLGFSAWLYPQYTESDWYERDRWMDVTKLFQLTGIKSGSTVADIGCHEGYLTVHLAKAVKEKGNVFAVDVRKDRLETLDDYLYREAFTNVKTVLGDYDNPKLPKKALDAIFIIDTYHEMDDYMTILKHVARSLKHNGRLLILEKLKSRVKGMSRADQTNAHCLSLKYVKRELRKAGFMITEEINDFGNWENDPDKVMWLLVAVPRHSD